MTGTPPKALLERPELLPGLDIYLIAYEDLQHDRQIGMALGTIPWSSIHRWALFHGICCPNEVAVLERNIRVLESAEREIETEGKPKK